MSKKIGLALGGGAARGFAHIGVLKVLEKNGIKIDFVSGTSIGSVIGALYCAGYSPEEMEKLAKSIKWKSLIDLSVPRSGLLKGDKIEKYIREKIENKKFSELNKKLFLTAVDINENKEVIFNKGDVARAVRASISIPGVFNPISMNKNILVDGGVLDPLPTDILKKQKADIIIGINLNHVNEKQVSLETSKSDKKSNLPSITKSIIKSIQLMQEDLTIKNLRLEQGNIIISPDLKKINYYDFHKVDDLIKAGEDATKKEINKIKKLQSRSFFKRFLKK
ncbi:MAG: patatin-like phospholipase family protein [Nanoarchaeota archaeon]